MMDHLGNAVECSSTQPFLNELLVFRGELDRHDSTLRRTNRPVNSMISFWTELARAYHLPVQSNGVPPRPNRACRRRRGASLTHRVRDDGVASIHRVFQAVQRRVL